MFLAEDTMWHLHLSDGGLGAGVGPERREGSIGTLREKH